MGKRRRGQVRVVQARVDSVRLEHARARWAWVRANPSAHGCCHARHHGEHRARAGERGAGDGGGRGRVRREALFSRPAAPPDQGDPGTPRPAPGGRVRPEVGADGTRNATLDACGRMGRGCSPGSGPGRPGQPGGPASLAGAQSPHMPDPRIHSRFPPGRPNLSGAAAALAMLGLLSLAPLAALSQQPQPASPPPPPPPPPSAPADSPKDGSPAAPAPLSPEPTQPAPSPRPPAVERGGHDRAGGASQGRAAVHPARWCARMPRRW